MSGPLQPSGLRVCRVRCDSCIFHSGNRMHLRRGRVASMVGDALRNDSFIPCHKTLDGQQAVCRGFYDAYADQTLGCRFGAVVGVVLV